MQLYSELPFYLSIFSCAVVFAIGNMVVHYLKADISKLTDTRLPLIAGFMAGLALGTIYSFVSLIPLLGERLKQAITIYIWLNVGLILLSLLIGSIKCLGSGNWTPFNNTIKIFLGNFYLNKNSGLFQAIWDGISRHSWELLQTTLGHSWAQVLNTFGAINRVDYYDGAIFTTREFHSKRSGLSLGKFIYISIDDSINGTFSEKVISDPLLMHEYGHSFDSRTLGILYLPIIGLSSLLSAAQAKQVLGEPKGVRTHNFKSYEMRANQHASHYFKRYHQVTWAQFETYYPLKKEGRI